MGGHVEASPALIMKPSVLFVCLGNICRSSLAEAAFRREAARIGLDVEVDSAGTGNWHVGDAPDRRAQLVAKQHGIDIGAYRARQVDQQDFHRFTHIIALDPQNLASLKKMMPSGGTATVSLLLDEVEGRHGQAVADPYCGDQDEFEVTWADVTSAAQWLARRLLEKSWD